MDNVPENERVELDSVRADAEIAEQAERYRANEENFRSFFNAIDECLFVLDLDGCVVHINATATRKLGYTEEELIGTSVLCLHPPDRREEAARTVTEMAAGRVASCPIPVVSKDGRLVPVETRVIKGRWDGQDVLFGISKDLSELRASEERFSKAFHGNPSPMAITSLADHRLLDANESFLRTLGLVREEVIGETTESLQLFADPSQRSMALALLNDRGTMRDFEVDVRTKDGQVRHGLFSAEYIQLQDQRVLLTVMNDITDRKQAQEILKQSHDEQLERHRAELAHVARLSMMGEMAAGLAHELNQPLHAIHNYAGGSLLRVLESPQGDPEIAAALNRISEEANRAAAIVRRVRGFVQKRETRFSEVSVNNAIEEVVLLGKAEIEQRCAKVLLELSEDPPIVLGDLVQIEQVVMNLVRNALEAMNETAEADRIVRIKTAVNGDGQVQVEVRDQGRGIAREFRDKVFEPFYTTKAEGMGMGLAISRSIVQSHGGSLWFSMNQDQGCTFYIALPVSKSG